MQVVVKHTKIEKNERNGNVTIAGMIFFFFCKTFPPPNPLKSARNSNQDPSQKIKISPPTNRKYKNIIGNKMDPWTVQQLEDEPTWKVRTGVGIVGE